MLKPQDIVVTAKLAVTTDPFTLKRLAAELGMSVSEVHAGIRRARVSRLVVQNQRGKGPVVHRAAFLELLVHGVRYVYPAERGRITRGIVTADAAPILASAFGPTSELPPVWPHPEGTSRGQTLVPLYRSVPKAALRDPRLYDLLALIDAMRDGGARIRGVASERLQRMLAT